MKKLDKMALIEAWARNQGYADVNELLDNGPYWPHFRTTERNMHIVFQCVHCGREIMEEYARQDPDFLAYWKCCHWCASPVIAARAIPFTLFYHLHHYLIGKPGGCWQCGSHGPLMPFTRQTGEVIHLCRKHRLAYARHIVRMADQREEKAAAIRYMQADLQPTLF